jgi:Glycosyl transferase family 2
VKSVRGEGIPVESRIGYSESMFELWTATLQRFLSQARFDGGRRATGGNSYTRISIVMPAYNQVKFIERSILSILNQNYPNLQFIIMDGGSTDGTLDIIRKYEKYLYWRSEPDQGQSDAINKALVQTDGELIGWLNSDDVYFPGAFYALHEALQRRPGAVLYSGTVANIDRDDRIVRIAKFMRPNAMRLLYEGFVMSSQGVFWRRALQPTTAQYDIHLHHAMDVAFWLKLLAQGEAEFLPQLIGGFRVYEGTKTSATGERGLAEMTAIRKQYGVDDQTMKWKVIRASLRFSRLLRWSLATRRHCQIVIPAGYPGALAHHDKVAE